MSVWPALWECSHDECETAVIKLVRDTILERLELLWKADAAIHIGGFRIDVPEAREIADGYFDMRGPLFRNSAKGPVPMSLNFEQVFPDFRGASSHLAHQPRSLRDLQHE